MSIEPITSLSDPLDQDDEIEEEEDRKPGEARVSALWIVVILAISVLIVQLYRLQIVDGANYRDLADNNRFRLETIPAPRGVIYDRSHEVLARNHPSYSVGIVGADLPTGSARTKVLQRLAGLLGVSASTLLTQAQSATDTQFTFVPLATNVPQQVAFEVEERHLDLPGVHVELDPIREYTMGSVMAPIIGYVGRITDAQYQRLKDDPVQRYSPQDTIGQVGIERTFETQLRGKPGQEQMEVDATGRRVQSLGVSNPQSGDNLILTIDSRLQKKISDLLTANIARYHVAAAVAIDPRNGQVLALVSVPSYDDNLFAAGISQSDYGKLLNDPQKPLLNEATSALYQPGATFHVITAIAGLQTGVITPTTTIDCPGFISVPNRFDPTIGTRLSDAKAFGTQDVESAIADSCNVFFYEVGGGDPNGTRNGLGIDGIGQYARMFGLGSTTGIDLVGESAGFVPSVRWKRQTLNQDWVPMDTYQAAVGQGYITVTPLQMANLAAAIANGGTLYRPQMVLQIEDANGKVVQNFQPDVTRRLPITPSYLSIVRQGMIDATEIGATATGTHFDGVAKLAAVKGFPIGGVVGSPNYGVPDASGNLPTHGWFVGFGPTTQPRIALAVFLGNGSGPEDAARVAHDIFAYVQQAR
ncbi:MAG TPA: penicillin-binding protein 2 [Chloroflexota bacterium]|nr:penicillin-binding protein 2 [Chloroflexota bacterium]